MNLKTLRLSAAAAALMVGIAVAPGTVQAQTPVQVSITTASGITATDGVDADFLSWIIVHPSANDTVNLVMVDTGAVSVDLTPADGAGDTGTIVQDLAGTAGTAATVLVTTPLGADNITLNMQRDAIVDFPDVALVLSAVTYSTVSEGSNLALAASTNVPVTVVTGGTDETVTFGGTVTVPTGQGNPGNTTHTASYNITFSY